MVKSVNKKSAEGTLKVPRKVPVVKSSNSNASAAAFSQEEMLKNVKKAVKAFGGDILKPSKDIKTIKEVLSSAFPGADGIAIIEKTEKKDTEPSQNDADGMEGEDNKVVLSNKNKKKLEFTNGVVPKKGSSDSLGSVDGQGGKKQSSTVKLMFKNVGCSEEVFKRLIQNQVSSCGPYMKCFLGKDGNGIVIVENETVAREYENHFNGYDLDGKQMQVSLSSKATKKHLTPSKEAYKSLTISGIPDIYDHEAVASVLKDVEGVVYSSLDKLPQGKWKVTFDSVPACVKFNSLVNGCTLKIAANGKTKDIKVKCESVSFGKKAANAGRVFVQNLPFDIKESKLEQLVKPFDKNAKVNLPTGNKKGFAFVQFTNQPVAEKAILKLNGITVGGRKIRLALSLPTEIYSAKPKDTDATDESGTEEDQPVTNTDAVYESHDDDSITLVDDSETPTEGNNMPSSAAPLQKDSEIDRSIFVRNLSYESTEEALRDYLSTFGDVESCRICKDEKGNSRGTAFVYFKNTEDVKKILSMEELALEREAEFNVETEKNKKSKVKQSAIVGIGFSLNGRRLRLSKALSRDAASTISRANLDKKERIFNDAKGHHLLMEGVIDEKSPAFFKLTEREQKLQIESLKEKMEKMKNPNMFINPKRLCVRNLPPTADINTLRTAIATHFRQNSSVSKICGTDKVSASKAIGKVTFLSDEKRKVKVGESAVRRRMPFAFIDFEHHELALEALRFLSNNASIYGEQNRLFAEFAIEDSRAIYIQKKRKEQYMAKLEESGQSVATEKRKKRKTYSRGKLQRMKRRKLQELAAKTET
ncbi:RNA-binding motif protein 14b like protein [Babesia gibsoni]|uniref:RNA-binding motif protein 14b like protein n=1 Tax=Babesia gibsoni TaxID=33632 RepID=A0AAD8PEX0_BABGI|nr:RNA-binding motif protein 14b like protein [Babesia gibsoni]